jgi:hypothetical protein
MGATARYRGCLDVFDRQDRNQRGILVVFRKEQDGFVGDITRDRARLVIPDIRRAVLIGKVIDQKETEAASLADTFDGISAGLFLVEATGNIVHATVAGHMMLKRASVLHVENGRLVANDSQADQMLADTFATAGNGDAAVGIKGVAVPLIARGAERYVTHVLPLTSGARRQASTSYAAVAALFVHKAASTRHPHRQSPKPTNSRPWNSGCCLQ